MTCSGEPDQSIAPPGLSPMATSSIGCNSWFALTDKGSVMEELETEHEDEEDEGRKG